MPILNKISFKKPIARFVHEIRKRSYKSYTKEKWTDYLAKKDWSTLEDQDLDTMVEIFTRNTTDALDEVAPFKTFEIKSQNKFGLSEETKNLICKRDKTRASISKTTSIEKTLLIKHYKKLRNLINSKIRKES